MVGRTGCKPGSSFLQYRRVGLLDGVSVPKYTWHRSRRWPLEVCLRRCVVLGDASVPPLAVDRPRSVPTGMWRTRLPVGNRRAPIRIAARGERASPMDQFKCRLEQVMFEWLLDRRDVVIVDTETTGLGSTAEVFQVAVINTRGDTLMSELVRVQERFLKSATQIHGWTRRKLRRHGAKRWVKVYPKLRKPLERAHVGLAWNAPFDERMIAQTCARYGLSSPRCEWQCWGPISMARHGPARHPVHGSQESLCQGLRRGREGAPLAVQKPRSRGPGRARAEAPHAPEC